MDENFHPMLNPNTKWLQIEAPRLRHESMWLVAQKFGYLNCLSTQDLRAVLAAGPRPGIDSYAGSSSNMLFRLIQRQRQAGGRPQHTADALRTRGPDEILGRNSRWLCDLSRVRYCEPCMDQWFHSTLFQITAIEKCPWHDVHLSDACQHCGKPLPAFEMPMTQAELLRCMHCQAPYSKKVISMDSLFSGSDWLTRILAVFGKLQGQIETACQNWELESRDQLDLLAHADNQRVIRSRSFEMLWTVAMPREALPRCCNASSRLFSSLIALRKAPANGQGGDQVLARLKDIGAQVKSIGRHLQRRVKRICGHAAALRPDLRVGRDFKILGQS